MTNVLTFICRPTDDGSTSITPCIDGTSLTDLVSLFEAENGHNDPAGGYAGIVPSNFLLGPLENYFLGQEQPVEDGDQGQIYALFCSCGEAGCWPLIAHVRLDGERVIWDGFGQPHRPARDYRDFGPFVFRLSDYANAVGKAVVFAAGLRSASTRSGRCELSLPSKRRFGLDREF